MIRAAITGLGWWGQNLVNAARASDTIRFTAACSRTRQTASAFCQEHTLRWTDDYESLLRDPDIDAVVLATPHSLHRDQVIRAARAGKAVFTEKPFALSLGDADAMLAAVAEAKVTLAVGFNRRFHPSMTRLRDAVRSGELGTLVTVNAEQTALHGLDMADDAWRAQPGEAPGGAMTAIGVHLVDGMIDLFGPVREVRAIVARRAARNADDTTHVLLSFESGAHGQIFCSTTATPHYRFAVYGTGGMAEILGHPMNTLRLTPSAAGEHRRTGKPEVIETPGFNMLTAELEEFAAAIQEKRPFRTPLTEIRHGVAVFEAILRSAASGEAEAVQSAA